MPFTCVSPPQGKAVAECSRLGTEKAAALIAFFAALIVRVAKHGSAALQRTMEAAMEKSPQDHYKAAAAVAQVPFPLWYAPPPLHCDNTPVSSGGEGRGGSVGYRREKNGVKRVPTEREARRDVSSEPVPLFVSSHGTTKLRSLSGFLFVFKPWFV